MLLVPLRFFIFFITNYIEIVPEYKSNNNDSIVVIVVVIVLNYEEDIIKPCIDLLQENGM